MIFDDVEEGMNSIMFPVRQASVYVESDTARYKSIPNKKALINDDTNKVLSIVSGSYQVLHNHTALELAKKFCIVAFPNTNLPNWEVFSIEAPRTRGHCRIDLRYEGEINDYDWSFGIDKQDVYQPFIRVCNSYNTSMACSIRIGLIRWACKNGIVDWHSSIKIRVAHDVREMEKSIEAKINEAKFRKVMEDFGWLLKSIYEVKIEKQQYLRLIFSILKIRKPEKMPEYRESDWLKLKEHLNSVALRYDKELGSNGYALLNAVSDIATRPPTNIGIYNFIRRERDGLQRLVGLWLLDFNKLVERRDLLHTYLENPSDGTLRPDNLIRF